MDPLDAPPPDVRTINGPGFPFVLSETNIAPDPDPPPLVSAPAAWTSVNISIPEMASDLLAVFINFCIGIFIKGNR